ncbi:unnamed protein product [Aureobasidium mustum]|uniref:Uncharacterized protein n=1 Tax=Aureobasidium mustum TaxID=2773714 RepID=A0A9N8PBT5_9PEZI|nr:unnamed protein product [Aureobasidium mustum]
MNPRDVSLNAHEQLEILAEIIKSSNIPPDVVIHFIRQNGIVPDWGDVALPRGRTVNQCSNWFYSVINQPGPPGPASGHGHGHIRSQSLQGPIQTSSLKRPFSPDQPSFAGGRLLVPKPPMSTIGNILNQQPEPPKKKRGRPTNAEKAARSQQEFLHGQPLLPPSRRIPPLASGSSNSAVAPGRPASVDMETRRPQQQFNEPHEAAPGPSYPVPDDMRAHPKATQQHTDSLAPTFKHPSHDTREAISSLDAINDTTTDYTSFGLAYIGTSLFLSSRVGSLYISFVGFSRNTYDWMALMS